MVANILLADPYPPNPLTLTLGLGSKDQNILPADFTPLPTELPPPHTPPPPTLGMGSIGQKSAFSEHGHVSYQIKENHECSSIVANILLADPYKLPLTPLNLTLGSKRSKGQIQLFQTMVMFYMKLKRISNAATW